MTVYWRRFCLPCRFRRCWPPVWTLRLSSTCRATCRQRQCSWFDSSIDNMRPPPPPPPSGHMTRPAPLFLTDSPFFSSVFMDSDEKRRRRLSFGLVLRFFLRVFKQFPGPTALFGNGTWTVVSWWSAAAAEYWSDGSVQERFHFLGLEAFQETLVRCRCFVFICRMFFRQRSVHVCFCE